MVCLTTLHTLLSGFAGWLIKPVEKIPILLHMPNLLQFITDVQRLADYSGNKQDKTKINKATQFF